MLMRLASIPPMDDAVSVGSMPGMAVGAGVGGRGPSRPARVILILGLQSVVVARVSGTPRSSGVGVPAYPAARSFAVVAWVKFWY